MSAPVLRTEEPPAPRPVRPPFPVAPAARCLPPSCPRAALPFRPGPRAPLLPELWWAQRDSNLERGQGADEVARPYHLSRAVLVDA